MLVSGFEECVHFFKKARLTAHSYLEHSQIDFLKKWQHKLGKIGLIALWILLNITELHHSVYTFLTYLWAVRLAFTNIKTINRAKFY